MWCVSFSYKMEKQLAFFFFCARFTLPLKGKSGYGLFPFLQLCKSLGFVLSPMEMLGVSTLFLNSLS